jgi:hypothetical protein
LVVRHNVDTAQPYSVVLLDVNPDPYSAETFEEAVDFAASVCVSLSAGRAPLQLRTTAGEKVGGPSHRDPAAVVEFLTDVRPDPSAGLDAELARLRRDRGGTALVVITGGLDMNAQPGIAGLRRQFDRLVLVAMTTDHARSSSHPNVTTIDAPGAVEAARRWNANVSR